MNSLDERISGKLLAGIKTPYRFGSQLRVQRAFIKIGIEFLTEVAVLVVVFPVLDTIIQRGQSNVTRGMVVGSFGLSIACIVLAGIAAGIIAKDDDEGT
jgi:hypothetical protein